MILHAEITDRILKGFYKVHNSLGYGFLERVYENALAHELRKMGLDVEQQHPIKVHYDGVVVGDYVADLLVEKKIFLELKTAEAISNGHLLQLRNYLNATEIEVGFILNFGPKPTFKRRILTNNKKTQITQNP